MVDRRRVERFRENWRNSHRFWASKDPKYYYELPVPLSITKKKNNRIKTRAERYFELFMMLTE